MRAHQRTDRWFETPQQLRIYTCGHCGLWFAVAMSFLATRRPIHCPYGCQHDRTDKSEGGSGDTDCSLRFLQINHGSAHHVVGSRTQHCHHYRRKSRKMREVPPAMIRDPWEVCHHCRKRLTESELEALSSLLAANGADMDLFTGW